MAFDGLIALGSTFGQMIGAGIGGGIAKFVTELNKILTQGLGEQDKGKNEEGSGFDALNCACEAGKQGQFDLPGGGTAIGVVMAARN